MSEPTPFEQYKASAERDMERFKIEVERGVAQTQMRAQILNEGSRGLTLINGGGAAALAAFLQAIWTQQGVEPMRWWVLFGMVWLIAGTAAGAMIFITRYFGSLHPNTTKPKTNPWWWAQMSITAASVLCFLVGMSLAVVGGFCAL